jgi:malate dehydrogenase (oxaloacetate-decarboxylating)(NADP+)
MGLQILDDYKKNKETAFTEQERKANGLEGLLPPSVETLDRQVERVLLHLDAKPSALEQYVYLNDLAERDQILFYRTVMQDPARFLPILYDPTVADACLTFGHIYRRHTGMYLTRFMKGRIAEVLGHWPERDVRFICVSTGQRILGLGDIGANGMGIPIGKLQLYTACAGVPPDGLLPILLDVGTTNDALRADALYLGVREKPIPLDQLDALTDELMEAVQKVFPRCCVHFEDWKGTDAIHMLDRYFDKYLCYNDDIQGTASVTLAGLLAALKETGGRLRDQRILFLGAGSAGLGIGDLIVRAMQREGLSEQDALARIALFDVNGLIVKSRKDLTDAQRRFAHDTPASTSFVKTIETFKPTGIIGVSTIGGAFTKDVVETMARLNKRPIIFPLSNPTDHCEVSAEDAYRWSEGRALYAAGVQFPDVTLGGKTFHPGQANNFYIFPAIGLATYVTRPKRLTYDCFIIAAEAAADQVGPELRAKGMLFPSQGGILENEVTTATRVAEHLFDVGLAQVDRPANIRDWIEGQLYDPKY